MPLDTGLTKASAPPTLAEFVKDWVEASSIIHFIGRNRLFDRPMQTGIDLGGTDGTVIRMMKAAGVIQHGTNVDLRDFRSQVDDQFYLEMFDTVTRPSTFAKGSDLRQTLMRAKFAFEHFDWEPDSTSGLITGFPNAPTLDEYKHMNIFDVSGKYDVVVSLLTFEYFSLEKILAKVRSLLNTGGIFVGMMEYFWWPLTSTGIVGHFPYASQRLCFEDLKRYFAEHHPEQLATLRARYFYFNEGEQNTLQDWCDAGHRNGLVPLALERIQPTFHHRTADIPGTLLKQPWFNYREVLRDIHCFKSGVTREDLSTLYVRVAMRAV